MDERGPQGRCVGDKLANNNPSLANTVCARLHIKNKATFYILPELERDDW
jgi:hypothetical protein